MKRVLNGLTAAGEMSRSIGAGKGAHCSAEKSLGAVVRAVIGSPEGAQVGSRGHRSRWRDGFIEPPIRSRVLRQNSRLIISGGGSESGAGCEHDGAHEKGTGICKHHFFMVT